LCSAAAAAAAAADFAHQAHIDAHEGQMRAWLVLLHVVQLERWQQHVLCVPLLLLLLLLPPGPHRCVRG
jgi:hypothetical protein